MKSVLVLLALAILVLPACAWDDNSVVYVFGMGMFRQEVLSMGEDLEEWHATGKINETEYENRKLDYNTMALLINNFLDGNFNNTIYRKWSLPLYPMS